MIIDEIKVNTKKELNILFNKLSQEGFSWAGEEHLLGGGLIVAYPAYIHLYDNKKVTWGSRTIEKDLWSIFWL